MTAIKTVTVSVAPDHTITVSPDPVVVNQANTLVVANLSTSGYTFPSSNAIVVNTPNSDFPYTSWTTSSTQASIFDAKGHNGNYEYTVTVVDSSGNSYSLDPIIQNGDP